MSAPPQQLRQRGRHGATVVEDGVQHGYPVCSRSLRGVSGTLRVLSLTIAPHSSVRTTQTPARRGGLSAYGSRGVLALGKSLSSFCMVSTCHVGWPRWPLSDSAAGTVQRSSFADATLCHSDEQTTMFEDTLYDSPPCPDIVPKLGSHISSPRLFTRPTSPALTPTPSRFLGSRSHGQSPAVTAGGCGPSSR